METQVIGAYTAPLTHGDGPVSDIGQFTGQHLAGFSQHRRAAGESHKRRVREAARLYADALTGRVDPYFIRQAMRPTDDFAAVWLNENYPGIYGDPGGRNMLGLRETMSVSDYQALYVDVLDRMYYGTYTAFPIPNKGMVRTHTLRDFRTVSRYMLDGMVSPYTAINPAAPPTRNALYGPVPQDGATLPAATTAPIQYTPLAYQSATAVNWAAMVNDDLGIFKDLALRLAIQGNRGISQFITQQFVDANGPNASLYTSAYGNIINTTNGAASTNPAFSAQGVADGFKVLAGMKDSSGQPILMGGRVYIWYGPSLTVAAQNLKRSLNVQLSVEGGTVNGNGFPSQFVNVENWIMSNVELVMDPYIPIVCTHATKKFTTWGITVDPAGLNRPAVELGFLSGFEVPVIYRKQPNTMRVGGGVEEMMGDFYSMDQEMKIIGVMGACQLDGRSTCASNGSGS